MCRIIPKVLVIDEGLPFPLNSGKKIRTYNLLANLAQNFQIDIFSHQTENMPDAVANLKEIGINTIFARSDLPPNSGAGFYLNVLKSLTGRLPYSVYRHFNRTFLEGLDELVKSGQYDLVHCEWTPYAKYLFSSPIPWVVSAHNIEAQILLRTAKAKTGVMSLFYKNQAKRMEKYESEAFSKAEYVMTVSDLDEKMAENMGAKFCKTVPNGVDMNYFSADPTSHTSPLCLTFTGSMDWRPNQDGIIWFIEEVAPNFPPDMRWKLFVVGRNPPSWLREACNKVGQIEVTGSVDDVRPFISEAQAIVVPLRIGGGSRLKILEAFAMGKPVISTSVGAEGLRVSDGSDIIIADEGPSFAREIERVCSDLNLQKHLSQNGLALAQAHYSWEQIALIQEKVWHFVLNR